MPDLPPDDNSRPDTLAVVKKIIERSDRPLNANEIHKGIPKLYQLKIEELAVLLKQTSVAGTFHRWPGRPGSRKERFWHQDETAYFRNRIYSALSGNDQTKSDLMASLAKEAVPCFKNRRETHVNTILKALVKEKTVFEIPPWGQQKKSRFAVHPPDLAIYLNKVRKEFDDTCKRLKKYGIGVDQLFSAFEGSLPLPVRAQSPPQPAVPETHRQPPPEPEITDALLNRIIQTILHIEPGAARQAPVWIPDLRQAMDLPKTTFDRSILMLSQQGKVFLNRHAHPAQLDDTQREAMIPDGQGNYFVVIGLREGFRG